MVNVSCLHAGRSFRPVARVSLDAVAIEASAFSQVIPRTNKNSWLWGSYASAHTSTCAARPTHRSTPPPNVICSRVGSTAIHLHHRSFHASSSTSQLASNSSLPRRSSSTSLSHISAMDSTQRAPVLRDQAAAGSGGWGRPC